MGQMVFDLGRFLIIFVLIVVAFGASYSAFKWPNNDAKHELNYITVFVEPFIQGLGEVSFLDDIGIDTSECTNTAVLKDCWRSLNQSARKLVVTVKIETCRSNGPAMQEIIFIVQP